MIIFIDKSTDESDKRARLTYGPTYTGDISSSVYMLANK